MTVSSYKVRKIIEEWCNEVGKSTSVSIDRDNIVTLHTKFPGYFIGYHGKTVEKYRDKLREIGVENVKFEEVLFIVTPLKRGKRYDN